MIESNDFVIKFKINGIIVLLLVMSISLWWHVIRLIINNVMIIIRTRSWFSSDVLLISGCPDVIKIRIQIWICKYGSTGTSNSQY